MNKTKKNVLFGIAVAILLAIGITLSVFFLTTISASSPDSHFGGEAAAQDIEKFDKYYTDLEKVKNFILEKCEEEQMDSSVAGGRSFPVKVEEGLIMTSSKTKNSVGEYYWVPFQSDDSIKQSIKDLKGYFETDGDIDINVLNDQVRFIRRGIRTIYSPDDSIPAYRYHPREANGEYSVHKLRENWYIAKNTTPYSGN